MPRQITERVNTIRRFKVRGVLGFPIDMLRYDRCTPDTETDSSIIYNSVAGFTQGTVEVVVCVRGPLTVGRWESFGWRVVGEVTS